MKDFIARFNAIAADFEGKRTLGQNPQEWLNFLLFSKSYLDVHGVIRPIVVEIGVMDNCQKRYYEELLNAEHIGIDVMAWRGGLPDIVGNSQFDETVDKLKVRLAGRPIDLLFIDGDHLYGPVKHDYEVYGSLTRHIIALHDISTIQWGKTIPVEVMKFWNELNEGEKQYSLLTFKHFNSSILFDGHQMGIGVIVKDEHI